jgi:hypothetical protein
MFSGGFKVIKICFLVPDATAKYVRMFAHGKHFQGSLIIVGMADAFTHK